MTINLFKLHFTYKKYIFFYAAKLNINERLYHAKMKAKIVRYGKFYQ